MALRTYGTMQVDWEQRADFDRLRRERLARAKEHLERSDLGALLCFDMANIRYITATHIGTWAMDKLDPLLPAAAGRRADHVGLRLGRAPPQALQPVARRGALARRHLDAARRGRGARGVGRGEDPRRARAARAPRTSRSAST